MKGEQERRKARKTRERDSENPSGKSNIQTKWFKTEGTKEKKCLKRNHTGRFPGTEIPSLD